MPEGDVLRLTAARLDAALRGAALVRAELRWGGLGDVDLTGREVAEVVAYGKNLLVRTTDGWTVHSHLRMEGRWYVARTGSPEALVSSGVVSPKICWSATRRARSMPLTILPH